MVEVDYDKMKVNLDCSQTNHALCPHYVLLLQTI